MLMRSELIGTKLPPAYISSTVSWRMFSNGTKRRFVVKSQQVAGG